MNNKAMETSLCSVMKISETILKTGQLEKMKAWYCVFLGVQPHFEYAPPPGRQPGNFGGQTRAADLRMCFFRLSEDYPFTQTLGLFEEPWLGAEPVKGCPGLHHMQFLQPDIESFIARAETIRAAGYRPHRSANHGHMTSFYYRDPDQNIAEMTIQNFPSLKEMDEFTASDIFRADPSGDEINPDEYIQKYRSGVPFSDLIKLNAMKS